MLVVILRDKSKSIVMRAGGSGIVFMWRPLWQALHLGLIWWEAGKRVAAVHSTCGINLGWLFACRIYLTHWAMGNLNHILGKLFSRWFYWLITWGISCEVALRWMSLDFIDKLILIQVIAWCRQATSHYLSQCCPRSLSPCSITRLQLVNKALSAPLYSYTETIIG